jgi:SsrA-binding protein
MKELALNRRAVFDYEIHKTYEAGLELLGHEVKAVKNGNMSLLGSFVVLTHGLPLLLNATIPPYQPLNTPKNYDPARSRRILLKKTEIKELLGRTSEKGLTIIPLKVYAQRGRIKILIGLARSKRKSDKRERIKKREAEREIRRTLKRE